ncbi:MAG: glycosyltransferase [Verrucomicrobia bacterium]|nr:glycosyltransferase [Verrucomicrobiota bacterium]
MSRGLRVCYLGAYDPVYARNAILRAGLEQAGVEVVECRVPLETPIVLRPAALLARFLGLGRKRFDAFIVAELNPEIVWLARLLGLPRRTPVVFDIFFSKYDAGVHDRATVRVGSLRAHAFRLIEGAALRMADVVLADTAAHAGYYRRIFPVRHTRFEIVPVGADERLFSPAAQPPRSEGLCVAGFWGTFIPLHGVETILGAAARLRDQPLRFEIVGRGQTYGRAVALVRDLGLSNVRLIPPMEPADLARFARSCDIGLGIFGATPKAARVVPHKVYQAALTGLPVVTRDSPAIREFFRDGEHMLLVPPADPAALAEALLGLANDQARRRRIGGAAATLVRDCYTCTPIGRCLQRVLRQAVYSRRGA